MRFGRVTGVAGGKARVEFADGQDVNSFELSTIQKRVLKDQDIEMPDTGEPVACLFSGQAASRGLCLAPTTMVRRAIRVSLRISITSIMANFTQMD